MAQTAYTEDITDFAIGTRSAILQLAAIHEPTGSNPYVASLLQVQATGQAEALGEAGRLRTVAEYSDGTEEELTDHDAPFDNYTIPSNTSAWVIVRTSGAIQGQSAPADGTALDANERLTLNSGKTLAAVATYWTAN